MTGLRDAKKAQVREALYQAALEQFRSCGYEQTSIADICKAAGVAKGTFFNHFPTKAHILADCRWRSGRVGARPRAALIARGIRHSEKILLFHCVRA